MHICVIYIYYAESVHVVSFISLDMQSYAWLGAAYDPKNSVHN